MGSSRAGSNPADCDFVYIFVLSLTLGVELLWSIRNILVTLTYFISAVMAEWLRRLTRNQMGSSRAGSNPADCDFVHIFLVSVNAFIFGALSGAS